MTTVKRVPITEVTEPVRIPLDIKLAHRKAKAIKDAQKRQERKKKAPIV